MRLGAPFAFLSGGDWPLWMAFDPAWSPQWVLLGYATALRATAVLVVCGAAAVLLRRAPAAARAGLWACALLAVLPLPALRQLAAAAPFTWHAHVVPGILAAPMVTTGATMVAQSWPGAAARPWTSVVGAAWALGAGLVLGRLLWAWAALAALARRARPVDDPTWAAALAERVRAVLTAASVSRRAPGRVMPAATALAGLALVAVVGTVRLAPRPAVLWAALAAPAWATRATAAEGIARYGDTRSVARLHAALAREPDARVRAMARFGAGLRERGRPALGDGAPFGWPQSSKAPRRAATREATR